MKNLHKKLAIVFSVLSFLVFSSALAAPTANIFRTILPEANNTYNIGSSALRWANIYANNVDTTTLTIGGASSFTQGSVIFVGAAGVLAQDNTNFFYNSTNHHLLLGGTTDGTGQLQLLSTSGTSAGGTTFGADTNFYRLSTGRMEFDATTGSIAMIDFKWAGTNKGYMGFVGDADLQLDSIAGQVKLFSNNQLALTLDTSQEMTIGTGKRILFGGTGASITGSTGGQSLTFTSGSNVAFLSNTTFVVGTDNVLDGTPPLQSNKHSIATTSTDAFVINNRTLGTNGVPVQMSPRMRLRGNAWDTAASQTVDFFIENLPASAATPTGTLKFGYSLNSAAATYPMTLTSAGNLNLLGKISTYNNVATTGNGIPVLIAPPIDSTGLTANVGATTLYSVPSTGEGMYRVSAYLVTTTAGSISSTMPNAQVVYTDKDSNTSVTLDVSPVLGAAGLGQSGLLTANTAGTVFSGVVTIYVKASTTIQYQTVNYSSNLAGMTYSLRIRLEAI